MSTVGSQCSQSKCSHGVWPCMVICEQMEVTIFCTHFLLGHLSLVYGLLSIPCSPSLLKSHMQLPFHVEIYSDWMFLSKDIPYGLCPWGLFQGYESFIKSLQITMGGCRLCWQGNSNPRGQLESQFRIIVDTNLL
jgi:hypothetical protein